MGSGLTVTNALTVNTTKNHRILNLLRANNLIFTSLLSDYRTWNDKCIALNYEIDAIRPAIFSFHLSSQL